MYKNYTPNDFYDNIENYYILAHPRFFDDDITLYDAYAYVIIFVKLKSFSNKRMLVFNGNFLDKIPKCYSESIDDDIDISFARNFYDLLTSKYNFNPIEIDEVSLKRKHNSNLIKEIENQITLKTLLDKILEINEQNNKPKYKQEYKLFRPNINIHDDYIIETQSNNNCYYFNNLNEESRYWYWKKVKERS